jgi:hypothetical protein
VCSSRSSQLGGLLSWARCSMVMGLTMTGSSNKSNLHEPYYAHLIKRDFRSIAADCGLTRPQSCQSIRSGDGFR